MSQNKQKNKAKMWLFIGTAITILTGASLAGTSEAVTKFSEEQTKEALQKASPRADRLYVEQQEGKANFRFGMESNLKAAQSSYSSQNEVVRVKDQARTNSCWAFSATTSLEHFRYKMGGKSDVFSPKHIEYATANQYADGTETGFSQYSDCVFNRTIDSGGNPYLSMAYVTSGTGPVLESSMPFSSPNTKIETSTMNVPKANIEVEKYIILPTINKTYSDTGAVTYSSNDKALTSSELTTLRDRIKAAIVTYGAIESNILASDNSCYNDTRTAYFCNAVGLEIDHAVTIIGWDDSYPKENFNASKRPSSNGAYIIQNSHGTAEYDNGYLYVSYEDVNIEDDAFAFASVKEKSYHNLYQYDNLGTNFSIKASTATEDKLARTTVYAANVFTKKSSNTETLYKVGINTLYEEDAEIYVVPNYVDSNSLNLSNAVKVTGMVHLDSGYQVINFSNPIEITSGKFAVIAKFTNDVEATIPVEVNYDANGADNLPKWNTATGNAGESFYCLEPSGREGWFDLNETLQKSNVSIKAFSVVENTEVVFGTNGSTSYTRNAQTTVTVSGEGEKTLKYQWTQSRTRPDAESFTQTFSSGDTITKTDGSGDWYLWIQVEDSTSIATYAVSNVFHLDNEVPKKPVLVPINGAVSGQVSSQDIYLQIQAEAPASGIQKYQYTLDDGTTWNDIETNDTTLRVYEEGIKTIKVRSISKVGIEGEVSEPFVAKIDHTIPQINLVDGQVYETLQPVITDTSTVTVNVYLNQVKIEGFKQGDTLTQKGVYRIEATDEGGLSSIWVFRYGEDNTVTMDKTGPAISFETDGSTDFKKSHSTKVIITDNMEVDETSYQYLWKQGETTPEEKDFQNHFTKEDTLMQNTGTGKDWRLWILAKDKQGNKTIAKTNPFYFDNTPPTKPTIEMNIENGTKTKEEVSFKIKGGSALCGIQKYQYSYDGVTWQDIQENESITVKEVKKYTVKARAINTLGVTGEHTEVSFEILKKEEQGGTQTPDDDQQKPNGGIHIGSGTSTNPNGGGSSSGSQSNLPTSTQGTLDDTKKGGIIPQTGETGVLSIVIRTSILMIAIAAIIIYEKMLRIERRK